MFELGKVKTRDEFRIYYRNLLVAAVLNEWYKERVAIIIKRKMDMMDRGSGEL